MDSKRFDNWTRNRALRLSRRDALRLMGASGAAASIPALDLNAATAQSTCSLTIRAETVGGPSAPASFDGTLQFTLDASGTISDATFAPTTGNAQAAAGRATGRAIDVSIPLPGNKTLALSGGGSQKIAECSGDLGGILIGPQPGDIGVWRATAESSSTTPLSTSNQSNSNQSSSNGGGDSTTPCPAGQTFCGTACIDTQADPQNCGACGTVCDNGQCSGGVCASGQTCAPDGAACNVPADCCSLLCPNESQAPGICGCSEIGGVCAGLDDCCQQGGDTLVACLGGTNSDRCIVLNGACSSDSDCLSQSCVNGSCISGPTCRADGEPCQSTTDCCNPGCFGGVCGCAQLGQSCSEEFGNEFFCCQGTPVICFAGACCILTGSACTADADCCDYMEGNGACSNGVCIRTT
jgi:hypothetical protein